MPETTWTFCHACGSHRAGKHYACDVCGSAHVRNRTIGDEEAPAAQEITIVDPGGKY